MPPRSAPSGLLMREMQREAGLISVTRGWAVASVALVVALWSGSSQAVIAFQDVTAEAGLTHTSQTYGLSWGDYDGDGWPDLRVGHHGAAARLYRNDQDGTFTNTSSLLQPSGAGEDWHTSAWADFDQDGDQDLVMVAGAGGDLVPYPNRLWINSNGSFSEQGAARGIDYAPSRGRQPVWWDWNNDGFLDLVVTNLPRPTGTEPSTIFQQSTNRLFSSVDVLPADELTRFTEFAQLGDLSGDGVLDLLTGGGFPLSYRILQASTPPLTDLTQSLGLGTVSLTFDAAVADLTGDQRPDLVLSRHTNPRSDVHPMTPTKAGVFLTAGSTTRGADLATTEAVAVALSRSSTVLSTVFIGAAGTHPTAWEIELSPQDASTHGLAPYTPGITAGTFIGYDTAAGVWRVRTSNLIRFEAVFETASPFLSVAPAGFTLDPGELDNRYYIQGPSGLTNASTGSALETPGNCDSITSGDFDNDMDVDLYLVCFRSAGNRPNRLFENLGGGFFWMVSGAGGAEGTTLGRGDSVATADYDRDGFIDLFVTNGWDASPIGFGPQQLFRNLGLSGNHWIEIDLEGTMSNRDGIGANVRVTAGGITQLRAQDGGMHARAQNHTRLHFGLGPNTTVDAIEVRWPSGQIQNLSLIPADQILKIVEVPEPGTSAGILAAGYLAVLARRRTRAQSPLA